jgi:hypothetical protein
MRMATARAGKTQRSHIFNIQIIALSSLCVYHGDPPSSAEGLPKAPCEKNTETGADVVEWFPGRLIRDHSI